MWTVYKTIILILILTLAGCATVTIEKSDGTIIKYRRIGNQEIEAFIMEDDGSVLLEKQKSDNAELYEAMNKLVDKLP